MYGVYDTAAEVLNYITNFVGKSLPLVIGEFGYMHSDGNPDEAAIMSYAQQYGIGYIGWSWCGNSGGVEYLDMVNNWNVNSLTEWGQIIINGANGIKATAKECTVFGGTTSSVSSAVSSVSSSRSSVISSAVSSVASSRSSAVSSVASSATSVQYQDINLPYSFDGAGEKWWKTSGTINYINSWNLDALEINGVNIKNQWVSGSSLPAKQDGYYYIHYKGSYGWSHVEINGTSGASSSVSSVASSMSSSRSSAISSISSSRSSAVSSAVSSVSSVQYTEITAPFTFDGAGEKYWKISNVPAYINSWNLDALTINDVDIKNVYISAGNLPAKKSDGYYYIYYKGSYGWSHVEIR